MQASLAVNQVVVGSSPTLKNRQDCTAEWVGTLSLFEYEQEDKRGLYIIVE